jgi:hypothetical protein
MQKVFGLHHLLEDPPSGTVGLIKKVARIFREAEVVFVARPPVDENHPQIAALVNEFGRDAVLDVLADDQDLEESCRGRSR